MERPVTNGRDDMNGGNSPVAYLLALMQQGLEARKAGGASPSGPTPVPAPTPSVTPGATPVPTAGPPIGQMDHATLLSALMGGGGSVSPAGYQTQPGLGTGTPSPQQYEDQSYGYPGSGQDKLLALLQMILNDRMPNGM